MDLNTQIALCTAALLGGLAIERSPTDAEITEAIRIAKKIWVRVLKLDEVRS